MECKYYVDFVKEFNVFHKNKLDESFKLEKENYDLYLSNRLKNNKDWLRLNERYFDKALENEGYSLREQRELKFKHRAEILHGNNYKNVMEFNNLFQ